MSDLRDMQEERRAWAAFDYRDGFANGFAVGVLAACFLLLLVVLIPGMLGWWA